MNRLFTIMFFLLTTLYGKAQHTKDSSTIIKVGSGIDFTGVRSGNFGEIQPSFSLTVGKKVTNNFYVFIGADFSNYRFSSDPFLKSRTTYEQGEFVTSLDTFHTVHHNRTKYIGLPIKLMYQNQNKLLSSYFSIGIIPSYNHWDLEFDQVLKNPSEISEVKVDHGKGSGLFGTAEAGISYNKPNWGLYLGVSSNYLIYKQSVDQEKLYSVGLDVGVTKKISPEKKRNSSIENLTPRKKMNAFYLELMGAGLVYSLNYERALIKTKYVSVHVRIGTNLSYIQEDKPDSASVHNSTNVFPDSLNLFSYGNRFLLPHYIPFSFTSSLGNLNKLELGVGVSYNPIGSAGKGSFIFGEFGYRREDENDVLFRFTFTPIIYMETQEFLPYIGVSLGKRF